MTQQPLSRSIDTSQEQWSGWTPSPDVRWCGECHEMSHFLCPCTAVLSLTPCPAC